jgi:hypothetical protein
MDYNYPSRCSVLGGCATPSSCAEFSMGVSPSVTEFFTGNILNREHKQGTLCPLIIYRFMQYRNFVYFA